MPITARTLGFSLPERAESMATIHSGTVATGTAARLEGMNREAQTTPPLPPSKRKIPTVAALRHSTAVGTGSPALRRQMHKHAPETKKRNAADRKGGMVSTAKRIAR
jgi:hypothetical protein